MVRSHQLKCDSVDVFSFSAFHERMKKVAEKKQFEVSLTLNVRELKDGVETPFFENTLKYHELGYEGVVAIEQLLVDALAQLADAGVAQAMSLGLGEKLSAMSIGGIDQKVAAMSK